MVLVDMICAVLFGSLKLLGIVAFCYIFYHRVIDYAHSVWFYGRQGSEATALSPGHLPLFGNLLQVPQSYLKSRREGDNFHIIKHLFDWSVTKESMATVVFFFTNSAALSISDPEVV